MALETVKVNPIVSFVYILSEDCYRTTLLDGSPGPNIRLDDIMTTAKIQTMDKSIDAILAEATQDRNNLTSKVSSMTTIKNDIDVNLPKVTQQITKIKSQLG